MAEIKLRRKIIYSGEVFASLMDRGWSTTEAGNFLRNIREADAVEVVHGRWITEWDGEHLFNICYCSACNKGANKDVHNEFILSDFCPNCGAKMDGGNEDGVDD